MLSCSAAVPGLIAFQELGWLQKSIHHRRGSTYHGWVVLLPSVSGLCHRELLDSIWNMRGMSARTKCLNGKQGMWWAQYWDWILLFIQILYDVITPKILHLLPAHLFIISPSASPEWCWPTERSTQWPWCPLRGALSADSFLPESDLDVHRYISETFRSYGSCIKLAHVFCSLHRENHAF
jgi:hypothetical protein